MSYAYVPGRRRWQRRLMAPRSGMATTMLDIARHCGLSRPTVNLVLSGRTENLRPATVARVKAAAAELGYHPNAAARAMRSGRFSTVALVSSADPGMSGMPTATLSALHDRLAASGNHLLLVRTPDSGFTAPGQLPRIATEHCADAAIFSRIQPIADPVADAIAAMGLPAVWWNNERAFDAVRPDDEGAGRRAVAELLARGHRRIAYLNPFYTSHISEPDRRRGFIAAMHEAGLEPEVHTPADNRSSAASGMKPMDWLIALLQRADRPSAIVLNGHHHTAALYPAAVAAGLRIPTDLSVLALSNQVDFEFTLKTSRILVPEEALGAAMADMALAAIANPSQRQATRRLPFTWVAGETIAVPPV